MFVKVFSEKRVGLEVLEAIEYSLHKLKTLFRGHKSSHLKINVLTTLHTKIFKSVRLISFCIDMSDM